MIASIIIIVISTLLFGYWFRYTCLFILNTKTCRDYTADVAAANHLSFPEVQERLKGVSPPAYDQLLRSLEGDYRLVRYLLRHTTQAEIHGFSLERAMLYLDFQGMKLWYALAGRISESAARAALQEMSQIVAHHANHFGERLMAETSQ